MTNASGESIMDRVTGSFFELVPGENQLRIPDMLTDITVVVGYKPKLIYNFDFDDIDWGD